MKKITLIYLIVLLSSIEILAIPKGSNDLVNLDVEVAQSKENNNLAKLEIEKKEAELQSNSIVGILKIPNTDYVTEVVQGNDNSYFLKKDASGKNKKGGTPFLDYRVNIDNSKKLLIYGHNSKYSNMPFKILENYYDESFYQNHKYLILSSKENKYIYEIFSVYVEPSNWSYTNINFADDESWKSHLDYLKENSIYNTGVELNPTDEILILQTCSTKKEFSKYKQKFLLVISKKITM